MIDQEEHWHTVKQLYSEAADLPESDRKEFVEGNTQCDINVRNEVIDLLDLQDEADGFFNDAAEDLVGKENLADDSGTSSERTVDPYGLIGQTFSHYHIIEQLGQGAMGVLYKAHDTRLERAVALKFITPNADDANTRRRMLREARLACSLDNNNVGVIHDIGQTKSGQDYIAMGYYEGETLDKLIIRQSLTLKQILHIGSQIVSGLKAIHEKDVVHCDIKPSNIMISSDFRAVILDFGVAKLRNVDLTDSQARLGTISYMSPEHLRGEEVDARSDIWSFGIVLYEMVAGARPFAGTHPEAILYSLLNTEPAEISSSIRGEKIPESLIKLINGCLQRQKEYRPQSTEVILTALNGISTGRDELQDGTIPTKPLSNFMSRRWPIFIVVFILSIVVVFSSSDFKILFTADAPAVVLPAKKYVAIINRNTENSEIDQLLKGLTAGLTRKLKLIERVQDNFWIIPSSDLREYGDLDLIDIGKTLGANIILILEVNTRSDNIELNLKLVSAEDQHELATKTLIYHEEQLPLLSEQLLNTSFELLDIEGSVAVRQKLTDRNTKSADAYANLLEGLSHMQRPDKTENINAAIDAFKKAIKIDPKYANAYANLGEAYWHLYHETSENQWLTLASQHLERALTLDSNIYSVYFTQAIINQARGNYGSAKAAYQMILDDNSKNVDALIGLAKVYEASSLLEDAEGYYLQAIALQPNNWSTRNDMGIFYAKSGRLHDALESFQAALEFTPGNIRLHNNIANTYWYLGEVSNAEDAYLTSIGIKPSHQAYGSLAVNYYYMKMYDKSVQMAQKAIQIQDSSYTMWGVLSSASHFAGQPVTTVENALNKAIEIANTELALNPLDHEILVDLAFYYSRLGLANKSLEMIETLSIYEPLLAGNYFAGGVCLEILGMRKEAIVWLGKALEKGHTIIEVENSPWLIDLRNDTDYVTMSNSFRK